MEDSNQKFTAFISYRHKPLDMAVAEELIRLIEHYRVPRELRKEGKTSLGKVFRDRDELGVYHDLEEAIYPALEQSEFLIVVCTPDTPKSEWVLLEIAHFLKHHPRENILVIHAAGTAQEAIPEQITHVYDEKGDLLEKKTPLSIFLADDNEKKVLSNLRRQFLQIAAALMRHSYDSLVLRHEYRKPRRKLKNEILRLLAALVGCPYDELVQRNKRYLYERLLIFSLVAASFLMIFTLVIVGKNRQISNMNQEIVAKNGEIQQKNEEIAQQLLQTQINESKALTLLSKQQMENGDRIGAMESALNALPHDGDSRPYYAPAEEALATAMKIYEPMELDYHITVPLDDEVFRLALSDDGQRLITMDVLGNLACIDTVSGVRLWTNDALTKEWKHEPVYDTLWETYTDDLAIECLEVIENLGEVIFSDTDFTYAFSLETGALLRSVPFCTKRLDSGSNIYNKIAFSADERYFVQYSQPDARDVGLEEEDPTGLHRPDTHYLEIYDTETFQMVHEHLCDWPENWEVENMAFSLDGSRLAIPFAGPGLELLVLDTKTWETVYQTWLEPAEGKYVYNAYPVWLPGNELLLSYEQRDTAEQNTTYFERFQPDGTHTAAGSTYIYLGSAYSSRISHFLTDTHIYYSIGNAYAYALERETLERTMTRRIEMAGSWLWKDSLMMVETEGAVSYRNAANKSYSSYLYQPGEVIRIADGVAGNREIMCFVPNQEPNTVVIAAEPRFQAGISLETPPLAYDGTLGTSVSGCDFWPTPDGETILAFHSVSPESDAVEVTVYDAGTMKITDWLVIEGVDYYGLFVDDFTGVSADGTKWIFENLVYDRKTGKLSQLDRGTELYGEYGSLVDHPPFYTQPQGAPLYSGYKKDGQVYWWTDGSDRKSVSIPYDMETYCKNAAYATITSMGHNGLFVQPLFEDDEDKRTAAYGIFSVEEGTWHLLENPVTKNGFSHFAIGAVTNQVAFLDMDRMLRIYDYDRDEVIHQWPVSCNPNLIQDMQYIARDRYLMIMMDNYQVHLVDMENGRELGVYDCDAAMIPYVSDGYVYFVNTTESLRVHLESGEVSARFRAMECCIPFNGRDTILYASNGTELRALPVYTWQELAEMGWDWVNQAKATNSQ